MSLTKVIADVDDLVIHDETKKFNTIQREPSKNFKNLKEEESFDKLLKKS